MGAGCVDAVFFQFLHIKVANGPGIGIDQDRTNTKYISSCISAGAGCSFMEFVNGYRIRKAKELLSQQPRMRMNGISEAVGYANESSFYRNFKNVEGCTPQQWLEKMRKKG